MGPRRRRCRDRPTGWRDGRSGTEDFNHQDSKDAKRTSAPLDPLFESFVSLWWDFRRRQALSRRRTGAGGRWPAGSKGPKVGRVKGAG